MNAGDRPAVQHEHLPSVLVPYEALEYPATRSSAPPTLRAPQRAPVHVAVQPGHIDPPTRRRGYVFLAAIVVVAVTISAIVLTRTSDSQEPERQVREMFAALTARDGERLAQVLACTSIPLCTAQGIATGYDPPQDVLLTGRQRDGNDRLQVLVRYRIEGVTYDTAVQVTRYRTGMFGHQWRISQAPGGWLQVRGGHWDRVRLAGIDIPASDKSAVTGPGKVWGPPGVYTSTAAGDALFEAAHATITVTGREDPAPATLPTAMKTGVVDEVQRQIRAQIDQCAADPELRPQTDPTALLNDCPFSHNTKYAFTRAPKWTLLRYPSIELRVENDTAVTVHTTMPGSAQISYDWTVHIIEPRTWNTVIATEDITVAGTVLLDNDNVRWVG
ncbi:hypothetical protein ABT297_37900 [Dactylosporangium sp. NPDC000555]|uniref:hypothetical protein n=1 Tax=Dactylosporangium sp. NPDC000555 TaxID=3154260 RepID=UPI003326328B